MAYDGNFIAAKILNIERAYFRFLFVCLCVVWSKVGLLAMLTSIIIILKYLKWRKAIFITMNSMNAHSNRMTTEKRKFLLAMSMAVPSSWCWWISWSSQWQNVANQNLLFVKQRKKKKQNYSDYVWVTLYWHEYYLDKMFIFSFR